MPLNKPLLAVVIACTTCSPGLALAQSQPAPAQALPSGATAQAPAPQAAGDQLLKSEQLQQLVSPIALYPDNLLAQVLMASTYPLEVVEASRWVTAHKNLKGKALQDAVDKEKWDASVKGLIATPQVLDMMSSKLSWTKDLGDAVLAQQADVMDAVQALRARADANKKLETTKEQKVTKKTENNKQYIVIESAVPDTVYVPYYDPNVVYGAWPYPAYPPYYYPPYGHYPYLGTGMVFAAGVALGAWAGRWWGGGCGWGAGNININNNFNRVTHWNHNPAHRQGVRYNNANVANRYGRGEAGRGNAGNRNDFRGRDGNRPVGDRPGAGNRPGGDRPGAGNRPGGGDRPGAGNRPGGGNRPSAGNRPSGGNRPSAGNRPSGGNRPSAGTRPSGGNAFSGAGGGGRNAVSHSARGHASMGGRCGGGSFHGGGGGGGFRGGGGGGGRGGGGGGRRSDIYLKHDITLLGYLNNGLGFYRFTYNGSEKPYVGVIAQEVQAVSPQAVTTGTDGYLRVHYEKLGVKFQTYQQWIGAGAVVPAGTRLH